MADVPGEPRQCGDAGWGAALAALSAQLDEADRRLGMDGGWGPEDVPAAVELPVGGAWTAQERASAEQLLARLQAVSARIEVALAGVAEDLGALPRLRDAAAAYGGG